LLKLTNDFKSYQQKFQYTNDDVQARESKISNLEFELDEVQNQAHLVRLQNQDLLNAQTSLKCEYENLVEQKRNCEKEITHLEGSISDLQMTLTTTHQQFKKEVSHY
jgi:chromosome segregation ATPase